MPWLLSLVNEKGEQMKPWVARKWGGPSRITPELQHAIWYEVERLADKSRPEYSAVGLAITFCKSPPRLSDASWEYAKQQLAGDEHRERQFTGTRMGDLFGEPGASPLSAGPAVGQSIEQRATEIQQTMPKGELDALHRQACDQMPPGLQRMCVAKGDPRKLEQVHALIVKRITAAAAEIAGAR